MKLSTRAEYGTRALLDLALHEGQGPILLREVAQRQQIPQMYLEHLIAPLIARGIIRSTRGARGGVWLAKPPQEIRFSEIIELLEGSVAPVDCLSDPKMCSRFELCVTRDLWDRLNEAINSVLQSTTLQDMVNQQKGKAANLGKLMAGVPLDSDKG